VPRSTHLALEGRRWDLDSRIVTLVADVVLGAIGKDLLAAASPRCGAEESA
jgi:hypothetical protein